MARAEGWPVGAGYEKYSRAIAVARGADIETTLRGAKIRSFYNNITDPTSPLDLTIDTQMLNAAADGMNHYDPVTKRGSGDGLIVKGNDITALVGSPKYEGRTLGTLPVVAQAIKELADEYGMLPQQAQAIMWVRWRQMHPALEKRNVTDQLIEYEESMKAQGYVFVPPQIRPDGSRVEGFFYDRDAHYAKFGKSTFRLDPFDGVVDLGVELLEAGGYSFELTEEQYELLLEIEAASIKKIKAFTKPGRSKSLYWPKVYDGLRRKGMSKEKSARISNAMYNRYRRWGGAKAKGKTPGPRSKKEYESSRGRKLPRLKKSLDAQTQIARSVEITAFLTAWNWW